MKREAIRDSLANKKPAADIRKRIGDVLSIVYEMIGLKPDNYPTPNYAKVIADYVVRRYGSLAPEELGDAFELAIAGELKVGIVHYQSFDLPLLSRVLNAYITYRDKSIKKVERIQLEYTELNDLFRKRPMNDKAIKNHIVWCYTQFYEEREGQIYYNLGHEYEFLNDIGLILTSGKTKNEYLEKAKARIETDNKINQMKGLKHFSEVRWKDDKDVMTLAKHYCVVELFEDLRSFSFPPDLLRSTLDQVCFIRHIDHVLLFEYIQKHGPLEKKSD